MVLPHVVASASTIITNKDEHGDVPLFIEGSDQVDNSPQSGSTKVIN
jgi:hypothetical protein